MKNYTIEDIMLSQVTQVDPNHVLEPEEEVKVSQLLLEEAASLALTKRFEPIVKRLQVPILNDLVSTLHIPGLLGQIYAYKQDKQVKVIKQLATLKRQQLEKDLLARIDYLCESQENMAQVYQSYPNPFKPKHFL